MNNTDTPADYYRHKQAEVDEIMAEMEAHADEHENCGNLCDVRRGLEKRLSQARYVGD